MLLFMSFIYSRKRTGPRTESCGTPDVTHVLHVLMTTIRTDVLKCCETPIVIINKVLIVVNN